MTTARTYRCNLCQTPIGVTENSTKGRGVYFTCGGENQPWFKFVNAQDAEHHLCEKCVQQTKEST